MKVRCLFEVCVHASLGSQIPDLSNSNPQFKFLCKSLVCLPHICWADFPPRPTLSLSSFPPQPLFPTCAARDRGRLRAERALSPLHLSLFLLPPNSRLECDAACHSLAIAIVCYRIGQCACQCSERVPSSPPALLLRQALPRPPTKLTRAVPLLLSRA